MSTVTMEECERAVKLAMENAETWNRTPDMIVNASTLLTGLLQEYYTSINTSSRHEFLIPLPPILRNMPAEEGIQLMDLFQQVLNSQHVRIPGRPHFLPMFTTRVRLSRIFDGRETLLRICKVR